MCAFNFQDERYDHDQVVMNPFSFLYHPSSWSATAFDGIGGPKHDFTAQVHSEGWNPRRVASCMILKERVTCHRFLIPNFQIASNFNNDSTILYASFWS